MKLLTFLPPRVRNGRFGALLSTGQVVRIPWGGGLPMSLLQCVQGGEPALDAVRKYVDGTERDIKAGGPVSEVYELSGVQLLPPLRPGKIMAVGRNYGDHVAEAGGHASPRPAGAECRVPG